MPYPPPPIVLQFINDDVIQFLTTAPGTAFARLIDFPLMAGGTWVTAADDRSAIWNAHDDKMYFLAEQTAVDPPFEVPPVGFYLIQYDPRALVVSNFMLLPVDMQGETNTLIDCTDERAWISTSADGGSLRAFDIVGMTQVFTDGGAFSTTPYASPNAAISCASGVLLLTDDMDASVVHRVTVTGPTTFTDTTIATTFDSVWANVGSYRRRWIESLNKAVLTYEGSGAAVGAVIDVAGATSIDIPIPAAWTGGGTLSNNGIFWDPITTDNFIVGTVNYNDGSARYGMGVFLPDGTHVGTAAIDATDYDTGSPAMPLVDGTIFAKNFTFAFVGISGFSESVPANTPANDYEATSFNTIPSGLDTWNPLHACIAPSGAAEAEIFTEASAGGDIGVSITDTATIANANYPGTITFKLYGPDDATCALTPAFTSDAIAVAGDGNYTSMPTYTPIAPGIYRWRAFYDSDAGADFDISTPCNEEGESVLIIQPRPPEGSGGSAGNCGVQFERLELFHMLKSLMGGGRTLREALKFLDQDDIDFLEEEDYMDELPKEIVKPLRQGGSPKMVNRRIDLTPINQLNKLIAEFETKMQSCVRKQVGEYDK